MLHCYLISSCPLSFCYHCCRATFSNARKDDCCVFCPSLFKNVLTEGAVSGIALVLFCMLVPEALAQAPALAVFLCLVLLPLALWMSIAEQSPALTEAGERSSSDDMAVVADEEDALPFF